MCKICIFAGTTEARRLVELLSTQPVSVTACVATEYGETLLPEGGNVTVRSGRIPVDGIIQMLSDTKFDLVIDATHPYAASITESAARACAETGTEYLRLLREESDKVSDFTCVLNAEAAALFLSKTDGNILLTTGSKDLKTYSKVKDFTDRAYARVLPLDASLALCREAGVQPSHILAMQGPFSEEMDTAMLRAVSAKWLVTKDGGEAGGFAAKVAAARKAGANVLVIGRPKQREGKSFSQVLDSLERRFGFRFAQSVKIVGIRSVRHLFRKEVIIHDPDYTHLPADLQALSADCRAYAERKALKRAPNYFKLWMADSIDEEIEDINERLEKLVEEMSNTKSVHLLNALNNYPIIPVHAHLRPFRNYWLNMACGLLVPIGLFFYFRIWAFRIRLNKDMERIIKTNEDIQKIIETNLK